MLGENIQWRDIEAKLMEITNKKDFEGQVAAALGAKLGAAMQFAIGEIINELPTGSASAIADKLVLEKVSDTHYQVKASKEWVWLSDGTGIYNPAHAGKGEGGRIVPTSGAKALHFRNQALAAALGFPDENVFLKSVKGIIPRFFWERHFTGSNLQYYMEIS
jgi:hypothetical protein